MKHRAMRKRAVFGAVLALSLVAGACGDDDDEGASDTEAPETPTEAPTATEAPTPSEAPTATDAPTATEAPDGTAAPAGDTPCLVSGDAATGEPIKVGSIQSKTGPDDFSSSGQGAKAFFECVNANGGINGRPVEFLLEDDQWTPEVASQLGAKLVNDEGVVAMVGSSSFVECGVNEPLYEAEGVVAVYGTGVPRECFHSKNISPTNAGPRNSALGIAQYMVSEYGAETMTCISQNIPNVGEWVCTGLVEWGETAGVTVRAVLHDPANPDFISIIQDAVSDNPDAVIVMEPAGLTVPLLAVAEEQDLGDATHWGGPTSQYLAGFPETIGEYWNGRYDVQAELTTIDNTSPDNEAWLATMDEYGEADDPATRSVRPAGWRPRSSPTRCSPWIRRRSLAKPSPRRSRTSRRTRATSTAATGTSAPATGTTPTMRAASSPSTTLVSTSSWKIATSTSIRSSRTSSPSRNPKGSAAEPALRRRRDRWATRA